MLQFARKYALKAFVNLSRANHRARLGAIPNRVAKFLDISGNPLRRREYHVKRIPRQLSSARPELRRGKTVEIVFGNFAHGKGRSRIVA